MGFAAGSTTLISKTTEVVGDIHFTGNLEVEGRVRGNIFAEDGSDARVRIVDKGLVEGQIKVPTVVINGTVNGDVHSSKHIELAAKAAVSGNVHYNLIEMVKGAQVNGSLVYNGAKAKAKAAPEVEGSSETAAG
ncbi:MAG: polymer-forming cytoskeletal protein [Candidatus Pelagadaptatus aseana]|uniref:bactofilin family protein n=1 Tax=Candidatus Pelagadaptatus aseana TaxID=3120508 RepID=UPI0039B1A42D